MYSKKPSWLLEIDKCRKLLSNIVEHKGKQLDFPKSLLERLGYSKESLEDLCHKYANDFHRNKHTKDDDFTPLAQK